MDLGGWLRRLGLEQYEAAFRENEIDETILPKLTAEDLKDLGVSIVGHRRKLLDAIAALPADGAAKPSSANEASTSWSSGVGPEDRAERRQVTVMFSDLVGSTALSARMDPEDLREVISAYQKCVAESVQRFGGFVAKYMGDGVLIYFGYPQAHEDDAERAVRAGLELVSAVNELETHTTVQTRVGIATGLVVVGDLIGSGASQEQAIIGQTPNLAARLQGIAEANTVIVAEGTRKLLGNLFELDDLGPKELKGIAGPVRAWAALRPASVESRFEAYHATGMTELVGREEELEILLRGWSKAKTGAGQMVLVSGEAGIGKSRLTAALMERLASEPHTPLRYFCSPQRSDSALYPIINQIERAAGLAHNDPAQTKLDKLDALLAQTSTPRQDAALFAEMLSLPNDGRYPAIAMLPQQRRQRTLEALITQIEGLAQQNPVLMIFEDVHWIDPTSLEALRRAAERIRTLRLLLIITYRPEFEPPWIEQSHVTALKIKRLEEREIAAVIDGVIGDKTLPASIRQEIIARTDGIPLFVEEMTKAVLEARGQETAEQAVAAVPSPSLVVPASLQASLMARLDRLGPAKEVAQIGATIGREFSHTLLLAVARKPEAEIASALDRLIAAGLLFRQGMPPQASYWFKHALLGDAAYSTLLRGKRKELHTNIAHSLESGFPEIVETQPDLLAQHCAEAGLPEKAVVYWLKAGQRAVGRGAMAEAVAQLQKGLQLLPGVADGKARQELELDLEVALGHGQLATKGYSAPEPGTAFARARQLCEQLSRSAQLGSVLRGQFVYCLVRGELEQAQHLADELRHLGEAKNEVMWKCFGLMYQGNASCWLGKFTEARTCYENALSLWDPKYAAFAATPENPYVASLCHLSRALLCLGYVNQARLRRDEALAQARSLPLYNLVFARVQFWWGIDWVTAGGKPEQAMLRSAEEVVAVSSEQGFSQWLAVGNILHGWCLGTSGQAAEGIQRLVKWITICRAAGVKLVLPFCLMTLAEVCGQAGQPQEGLKRLAEAAELFETTKERWTEAEIHRMRGTLSLSMHDAAAAEDSYRRALAVARQQQAKLWELRAATSMARLWRDQGKRGEARELLISVYGWFTEGFDTLDLKQAKALLDELA
jgi:class 3 adenylate cyclase/predicted ATPase